MIMSPHHQHHQQQPRTGIFGRLIRFPGLLLAAAFLAAAAATAQPVLVDLGATAPTPGASDIYQLSTAGNTTFPDGINYYTDNFTDHGLGEPGQTFTTGSNPAGYQLNSIAFQTAGLASDSLTTAIAYVLHIYSVAANGVATPIETDVSPSTLLLADGDWIQWQGLGTPLQANATYAYSFGKQSSGNGWEAMAVATPLPYAGGQIGLILPNGGPIDYGSSHSFDAVFDIGLTPLTTVVAPTISTAPTNVVAYGGYLVQLVATATGTELSYQWQVNGVNLTDGGDISGSQSNILTFSSLTAADANTYTILVSNPAGSTSASASVTWQDPATAHFIWSAPVTISTADATLSQTGYPQGAASFGATSATVTYTNGFLGVTNATLNFTTDGSVATVSGGAAGTVTFTPATANANFNTLMGEASVNGGPKTITLQNLLPGRHYSVQLFALNDATGAAGAGANLAYFVNPNDPQDYSATIVMRQNAYIIGSFYASNATETITEVLPAANAGDMNALVLRLLDPQPAITIQPASTVLFTNRNAHFTVAAIGAPTLGYTWQRNGVNLTNTGNISGATTTSLTVSNVTATDVANYTVVVTNASGSTTSLVATLSLATPNNTVYETAVRTNNPVVYFEFNELSDPLTNGPAFDYVGGLVGTYGVNAQNGLAGYGGPVPNAGFPGFSPNNYAVSDLHGAGNSFVTFPAMNLNTNSVTLTAWINPSGSENPFDGVVFCRGGGTVAGINYTGSTDPNGNYTLGYTWNNDANTWGWNSQIVPPAGQWSFVALVITPTNGTIYLLTENGSSASLLSSANAYTNPPQSFSAITYVGNDPNSANGVRTFGGLIDEVAVYNKALTALQLEALFGAASGVTNFPPTIGAQPVGQTLYAGRTAKLSVLANGTQPLAYQWQKGTNGVYVNLTDGGHISGSATASLTISNLAPADGADYIVTITNLYGTATSQLATIGVVTPACNYEAAVVAAKPLAYWRFNEAAGPTAFEYFNGFNATYAAGATVAAAGVPNPPFPGFDSTNTSMLLQAATANSWAVIPGVGLNTNAVTFVAWVFPTANPATFTGLLFNRNSGDVGGFGFGGTVNALGMPALGYTWNNNNSTTYGWNSAVFLPTNQWSMVAYVLTPTNTTVHAYNTNGHSIGTLVFANANQAWTGAGDRIGSDSGGATRIFNGNIDEVAVFNYSLSQDQLTTLFSTGTADFFPPAITVQPTSKTLYNGTTAYYSGAAFGSPTIRYQWLFNGATIPGATSALLGVPNVGPANVGGYSMVASNAYGAVTSSVATLTLTTPAGNPFESAVLGLGPVAYYELNEKTGTVAYDYAGGFNGTYGSAAALGVAGVPNPPYTGFPATNTAVRTTNNIANSYVTVPAFNLYTNAVTMSCWVYPNGNGNASAGFFFYRNGNDTDGIGYGAANVLGYTWNPNASSTYGFNSGLTIPTNQWSFVALTVSPTNAILYLFNNGVMKSATNAIAHIPALFNATARIGEDSSGNGRIFNGVVDDAAIFNYTLTGVQLLNLYTSAGVPVAPPVLSVTPAGNNVIVSTTYGQIYSAPTLTGPWSLFSTTSPATNAATATQQFYRALQAR